MSGTSSPFDYAGSWKLPDGADAFSGIAAVVRRMIGMIGTSTLVQVKAVTGGGLGAVGFVDVQPLVHQQDGSGQITPHGVIHNLPFFRLQGGASAVICDPMIDDIGLAIIANRDISKVKITKAPAAPDSFRQHDPADGLYIGGFLNRVPNEYAWLTGAGIHLGSAAVDTTGNLLAGVGATGSFSTPTGQTVTVRDGIITNIF